MRRFIHTQRIADRITAGPSRERADKGTTLEHERRIRLLVASYDRGELALTRLLEVTKLVRGGKLYSEAVISVGWTRAELRRAADRFKVDLPSELPRPKRDKRCGKKAG